MNRLQLGALIVLLLCSVTGSFAADSAPSKAPGDSMSQDLHKLFDQRYEAAIKAIRDWYADPKNRISSGFSELQEESVVRNMGLDAIPFLVDLFEKELASPHWDAIQRDGSLRIAHRLCLGFSPKQDILYGFDYHNDVGCRKEIAWYVKSWRSIEASPRDWLWMMEWRLIRTVNPENAVLHKDAIAHLHEKGRLKQALPFIIFQIEHGNDGKYIPLVDELMETKVCGDNPTREQILEWWEANRDSLTTETTPPPAK